MQKGLGFRMESMIGFQPKDDIFIVKMKENLDKVRAKISDGYFDFEVERDEDAKAIEKLINDRFKMNVHLVSDGDTASVIPFFATDNNILMKEYFRQDKWLASERDFFKGTDLKEGWVDLETAQLGGSFSKGKSTIYLNFNKMISHPNKGGYGLSNPQITAIALHEIGHTFYPLAHAALLDRNNLILEQAKKELLGKTADRRAIIKRAYEKLTKADGTKIANDLCSENPELFSKAALKMIGEQSLQHQADAKYSNTNFEMMADNFAVRFGLGKELVTALEKMTPGGVRYGDIFRAVGETTTIVMNILAVIGFLKFLSGDNSALSKAIVGILWFFLQGVTLVTFFYVLVRMAGESSKNYTYDDLVHRYSRIRMQMIADIKTRKLTKGDATRMIESIEVIGELVKNGRNWRTPLDFLFNTFNPADRRAKDSIGRQQAMEALVNNDLFLSSLKLAKLAG